MDNVRWTASLVEERLAEAASVLKRLPPVTVQGYFNTWPQMVHEFGDLVGQERVLKRPPPSAAAISRMDQTITWTIGLDPVDAKILWLRAHGERWKRICASVGLARASVNERWLYGLSVIAWRLNNKRVPKAWSRRRFLTVARDREPQRSR
ncbi:MAG: DUF6362 family protein [Alphaproteobacteria bacterium]|nr:DUF6362 family protein [Alphaproteobacteria bacterium]